MSEVTDWNRQIIDQFRSNDGKVGGQFEGAPLLLLHSRGAKSGRERVNPVMYLPSEGRYIVFASKAGAPTNPDWYHNLKAHPVTTVEVGSETLPVTASEITGGERDTLYARQAQLYPGFAEYQAKTDRTIPVLALIPR